MVQQVGSNLMNFTALKKTLIFMLTLLLVSCTEPKEIQDTSMNKVNIRLDPSVIEILENAEKIHKQASDREHAWIITTKHVQTSREALAAGHTEEALISANRALLTAKASLNQADTEETAWKARVLKPKI
ncbi:MAG: hypothetical protein ACI9FB_000515 [Candidatus Azotimanducaceae bacterium]|jgi:hypothetical protein